MITFQIPRPLSNNNNHRQPLNFKSSEVDLKVLTKVHLTLKSWIVQIYNPGKISSLTTLN